MTESDTMWRWWLRVTVGRQFPAPRPPLPVSFDDLVYGKED